MDSHASQSTYLLGISAYYHDSAAALLKDGQIVAAAQEERFTRKKHDAAFPHHAIQYCLDEVGIGLEQVRSITFYDKPWVKFERLMETYIGFAPHGLRSYLMAVPIWLKEKLFLKTTMKKELAQWAGISKKQVPPILFAEHHQSHAASAFFPSPFERAVVLCLDGVGEWATTTAWLGEGNRLTPQWEIKFPHSLGLLYSAFTYYAGFKVNSGEYKLMGLAPYGEPKYVDQILGTLMDLKEDGTFRLNMDYFGYPTGLTMTNGNFEKLFGGPPRAPESQVTQKEMDLARSIQWVTEEVVLRLGKNLNREFQVDRLCMAGGVALNCVANGRLLREGPFKEIWIQPAAGDAGGALGAALATWHEYENQPRTVNSKLDSMSGSFLGPVNHESDVRSHLDSVGAVYRRLTEDQLFDEVSQALEQEKVVGWVQDRMEFGPRALGNRSILGDPRSKKMQSMMNLKIKYRESFRPFAPAVLSEDVGEYFDLNQASPYMLLVAPVKKAIRIEMNQEQNDLFGIDRLNVPRSSIPAVTHVDYSARVQTVDKRVHPKFHRLLSTFKKRTGCSVLVNTSFNVRGEPIVMTAQDAYRCFMRTEMDVLVLGEIVLDKRDQPVRPTDETWKNEFQLD